MIKYTLGKYYFIKKFCQIFNEAFYYCLFCSHITTEWLSLALHMIANIVWKYLEDFLHAKMSFFLGLFFFFPQK